MNKCCDCKRWDTSSELDCACNKIQIPQIGFCPVKEAMQNRNAGLDCIHFEQISRFKPMDVVFGDNLRRPRQLILEINPKYESSKYTTIGEGECVGYHSENSLKTLPEWLLWVDRFLDELTGRELREIKEAATAQFIEPKCWGEFRDRYLKTGNAFLL